NDDQAIRAFGVEVGIKMTLDLIEGGVCGIHYYTFNLERSTRLILEGAGLHWGSPDDLQDICRLFVKYCNGETLTLPWSDQALALESGTIRDRLIELNSTGYLTINSQPAVNGAKSDDKVFGWGPKGGYVYQK
ncbi:hypothetical protein BGX29_005406, partial [Mortierella sp. GBA35]